MTTTVATHTGARLAWGLALGAILLIAGGFALDARTVLSESGWALPIALPFVAVGALVGAKRPGNPVGWLLPAWGTVMCAESFA